MWIPDPGLAEVASWRIAAALARRHRGVEVRWDPGPGGVAYDVMRVTGTGRAGPFHQTLNRTGTVQGWLEDASGDRPEVELAWDAVLDGRTETGGPPLDDEPAGLDAAVERIERALLRAEGDAEPVTRGFAVRVLAAVVAFHVGGGARVRTRTEWVDVDGEAADDRSILAAFPQLAHDVRMTQLGHEVPADEVWVVSRDGEPVLAVFLPSALAWVVGRAGPVDLHTVSELVGFDSLDAEATAAWLVGPMAEHEEVLLTEWPRSEPPARPVSASAPPSTSGSAPDEVEPPVGELGLGVIQAVDDPGRRFVVLTSRLGHRDTADGRTLWTTTFTIVGDDPRTVVSERPHVAGRDDPREGLVFHDGDRAYAFRALRDEDTAWVSRYDVDLGAYDLRLLVSLLGELREEMDDPRTEFPPAREAAEELVALVADQGTVVFGLHYMLLDGRRVINPQFRDEGEWSDEIPYLTDLWRAEARRVIDEGLATPDPEHLMEDEDPANDPFMLLGVAEYLQIHPTMARAVMELFDRGHPIPASVARLAEGHADDLVRPGGAGGWESEPWGSASSSSPSSDALRRRTEPMRRIDLMQVLYDISLEFSSRR